MGLTKRKDGWYVEFPVTDDGKVLQLARGTPGAKLKRWKTLTDNKTLAKQQEAKIKTDLMMGKIVSERVKGPMTFKALTDAYLADPKIQRQTIYQKKENWINKRFLPTFGASTLLTDITEDKIERYLENRRKDDGYQGTKAKTATVNRELAGIKHLFTWGVKKEFLQYNPARFLRPERENNLRDEILDPGQFAKLQACSPSYLQPINYVAYITGMREGEILGLTWEKVDLKGGFIRLQAEDTKTREGRTIPLNFSMELLDLFKNLFKVRSLHSSQVFLRKGEPIRCMREAFKTACQDAGIQGFRFHDFRHTAITNMRRAGIDHLTIMWISGHKTMACFTRYNSFREPDLQAAARQFNTYLTLAPKTPPQTLPAPGEKLASSC
jgi:integrase